MESLLTRTLGASTAATEPSGEEEVSVAEHESLLTVHSVSLPFQYKPTAKGFTENRLAYGLGAQSAVSGKRCRELRAIAVPAAAACMSEQRSSDPQPASLPVAVPHLTIPFKGYALQCLEGAGNLQDLTLICVSFLQTSWTAGRLAAQTRCGRR